MKDDIEFMCKALLNAVVRLLLAAGVVIGLLFMCAFCTSPIKLSVELTNEPSLLRACIWSAVSATCAALLGGHGEKHHGQ